MKFSVLILLVWTMALPSIQAQSSRGSYLGVGLFELGVERASELGMVSPRGVEVSSVAKDSSASRGGLVKGDVILEFRGEAVVGVEHFVRLVRETSVDREVSVRVWRDEAETELTVTVGRRPGPQRGVYSLRLECGEGEDCLHPSIDFTMPKFDFDMPRPRMVVKSRALGVELEGLEKEQQLAEFFGVKTGVLIRSVDTDSLAAKAGLKAGDVIVAVDGKSAGTPQEVGKLLRSTSPDRPVAIELMRNRAKKTLTLERSQRGSDDRPSRHRRRGVSARTGERL